jgi:hypothetical protein
MTPLRTEEETIEEMVAAGYDWNDFEAINFDQPGWAGEAARASVLFRPEAWQALGRARGWPTTEESPKRIEGRIALSWLYYARQYFETGLASGSTEEFWKSLP